MAIFLLLMVIFLSLVKQGEQNSQKNANAVKKLNQEIEQLKKDLAASEQEKTEAEQKQKIAEENASRLQKKPVDLVIAVDGTSSMKSVLNSIQRDIETSAEIMARLSSRFRLGLVVYRNQSYTFKFPLTEIKPTHNGVQSEGKKKLHDFLHVEDIKASRMEGSQGEHGGGKIIENIQVTKLEPLSSDADVEYAVTESLSMLQAGPDANARRVLILAGDVGPWEKVNMDRYDDPSDIQAKNNVMGNIQRFASKSDLHRVWTIYTGPQYADQDHPFPKEAIAFFQSVANTAGEQQGRYLDDASQIAVIAVEAAVAIEGN